MNTQKHSKLKKHSDSGTKLHRIEGSSVLPATVIHHKLTQEYFYCMFA